MILFDNLNLYLVNKLFKSSGKNIDNQLIIKSLNNIQKMLLLALLIITIKV